MSALTPARCLPILILSLPASADRRGSPPTIAAVCAHAMGQTMRVHGDQFLAEVTQEVGDTRELDWMIESTRAQWQAELERQCIESLIPIRRQLVESDRDRDYRRRY